MKCVIPDAGIRVFGKTIHCLTKIGDELFMETRQSGLSLKTVNLARSAYVCFEFNRKFFNSFKSGLSGNRGDNDPCCCKVMAKSFLSIFRALSSLEKSVIRCNLSIDFDLSKIFVVFHCKHGIIKTHQIGYSECEILKAVYDKDDCTNKISGASRPITEAIVNFPNNLDEITLIAKNDELLIKNYIEDPQNPNRVPLTEVHLLSEEFDGYSVSSEGTSVTFCLKELRAIIAFTDAVGDNLSIRFDTCGKPVILSVDDNICYTVDAVLASLMEEETFSASSSNTSKPSSSNAKLSRRRSSSNSNNGWHRIDDFGDRQKSVDDDNDQSEQTRLHTNSAAAVHDQSSQPSLSLLTSRKGSDSRSLQQVDETFITNQIDGFSPSCLETQHRFEFNESMDHQSTSTNTQQNILECSGFVPSTPPPAKKFKSLFSTHDIFGGFKEDDSILAPDSEDEY